MWKKAKENEERWDGDRPQAMTMTMTHSEKSIQQPLVAWPYRRDRRGHDSAKKSL